MFTSANMDPIQIYPPNTIKAQYFQRPSLYDSHHPDRGSLTQGSNSKQMQNSIINMEANIVKDLRKLGIQ